MPDDLSNNTEGVIDSAKIGICVVSPMIYVLVKTWLNPSGVIATARTQVLFSISKA